MTERLQRLVKSGYVIFETKLFIVLGMYSKNVEHPIKKIFHYLPVKVEKKF